MKRMLIWALVALTAVSAFAGAGRDSGGAQTVTIQFATAGDTNMVDFFNQVGRAFTEIHPHIRVNVVGTGPGDSGSRNIYTRWKAQMDARRSSWDLDAACVHESIMADTISDNLIVPYVRDITNARYVNTPSSQYALGTPVEGYVVPLFTSQIVLAYNPARIPNPPKSINELEAWI